MYFDSHIVCERYISSANYFLPFQTLCTYYRSPTKLREVMFSWVSVSHSVHREVGMTRSRSILRGGYTWSHILSGDGYASCQVPSVGGYAWCQFPSVDGYAWSQVPSRGWVCLVQGPFWGWVCQAPPWKAHPHGRYNPWTVHPHADI